MACIEQEYVRHQGQCPVHEIGDRYARQRRITTIGDESAEGDASILANSIDATFDAADTGVNDGILQTPAGRRHVIAGGTRKADAR
jgi:hypothetical protein